MCFLPGLFFYSQNDLQRKFLNSLGKNSVPLFTQTVSTILHVFWSYVFIEKYGIKGTGIVNTLSNFTSLMINLSYTQYFLPDINEAVFMPNKTTIDKDGIIQFLNLGIPSGIGFILDAGAFYIMVMTSGYLGVLEQGTNTVLMNIVLMIFMIGSGL